LRCEFGHVTRVAAAPASGSALRPLVVVDVFNRG
jgi:hypothetical protein